MNIQSYSTRLHLICHVLLIAMHLQISYAESPVCNTKECKTLANMYLSNLDESINPCQNFYKYACQGWHEKYSDVVLGNYWNNEEKMQESVYLQLKKILEDKQVPIDENFKQAKMLYRICASTPYLQRSEPAVLRKIMQKIAPWQSGFPKNQPAFTTPIYAIDKQYIKATGLSAFFEYKIRVDEVDHNKIVTELRRPLSPYGILRRFQPWDDDELKEYKMFLEELIREVIGNRHKPLKEALNGDLYHLINFREDFREIIKNTKEELVSMTILEFQNYYHTLTKSAKMIQISWLEMIRTIYTNNKWGASVSLTTKVIVDKAYFTKLAGLLSQAELRVLVNHVHLSFMERHIKLTPTMIPKLKSSYQDGLYLSGRVIFEVARWRTCIIDHNMKETLSKMYLATHFTRTKQAAANVMVKEAKRLLLQHIQNSNWVNQKTKSDSEYKINTMKSVIGHPEWYTINALKPKNTDDEMSPIIPDVYYQLEENRVCVSASYLQLPLCGKNLPFVINYGATMPILGHEVYHAFDEDGIRCSGQGDSHWWSKIMCDAYSKQLTCFKEQYEEYRIRELRKRKLPLTISLPSTLSEDVPDVMGLKLAYMGFKQTLEKKGGICPILPGFEKFGCEKLFFIAFANTFCTYASPGFEDRLLFKDLHSFPEIRVNGAVSNMRQFSAAFGCKPNDPMKLSKTCDIWKR